jgi:phosphatidylinositol alpha-mannosyltransferase
MAAGRCVVAADHGPAGEWITDRVNGRLFRPGDAADLARVVGEVLGEPAARRRMGAAAAERVRRRHDPDAVVERLIAVYEEAIRSCGSR